MAGPATEDEDSELDEGAAAPAPKKKGKGLIIGALVLLLVGGGAGGYFFFAKKAPAHGAADEHGAASGEHGEGHAAAGATNYVSLEPAFVVNLNDEEAMRFLQVQVDVVAHDKAAAEAVKLHMPRIRNSLLMLFGQQRLQDINTRAGKEALQKKTLEEVQKVLKQETGSPGVDAVYFTSFVMQ